MRRFRAGALPGEDQELLLDEAASHHLLRVCGIAPGERIGLFDGAGRAATAELIGARSGRALVVQRGPSQEGAARDIVLLVGLSKHAAFDVVLRMATELGVRCVQPVEAARSVVKGERVARWERIVEAAAAQSGRADVPEVRAACSLVQALDDLPEGGDRRILLPGGPGRAPATPPCVLLIGPEGGLEPREVELALSRGFQAEGIGSTVLRVDTAVAAALARVL